MIPKESPESFAGRYRLFLNTQDFYADKKLSGFDRHLFWNLRKYPLTNSSCCLLKNKGVEHFNQNLFHA
jgi:hypothetical protein